MSIESIYQSKLAGFYNVAQAGAAKLGSAPGVFSDMLSAMEQRLTMESGTTATAAADETSAASSSSLSTSRSTAEIEAAVEYAARTTGVDADLIRAVIQVESSFRTGAVSSCGAQGLMQLMPGTAREMGVENPFDALDNVLGGAGVSEEAAEPFWRCAAGACGLQHGAGPNRFIGYHGCGRSGAIRPNLIGSARLCEQGAGIFGTVQSAIRGAYV